MDMLDFIRELEGLRELRSSPRQRASSAERIAATLEEVPVGTLLIDRSYFPWVANRKSRKMEKPDALV